MSPDFAHAHASLPPREAEQHSGSKTQPFTENEYHDRQTRTSYRDSLPDAPRPVVPPSSYEQDSVLEIFYGDMLARQQARKAVADTTNAATANVTATATATTTTTDADAAPPALPQKSSLRSSRMLPSLGSDRSLQKPAAAPSPAPSPAPAEPHDLYLSSEEDISSSADDFSDYDSASESELSEQAPVRRRRSHEDTARVVSVVYMGRPSIVNLSPVRSASPASSVDFSLPRPLVRAATDSNLGGNVRRLSVSTSKSASTSLSSSSFLSSSSSSSASPAHPPRTSSMYMAPTPASALAPASAPACSVRPRKPLWVNIDPFGNDSPGGPGGTAAAGNGIITEEDEGRPGNASPTPRTPKTPSAILRRGLNLVRKRSTPLLGSLSGHGSSRGLPPVPPVPPMPSRPSMPSMPRLQLETRVAPPRRPESSSGLSGFSSLSGLSGLETPLSAVSLSPPPVFRGPDAPRSGKASMATPPITPIGSTHSSPAKKGGLLGFRRQSLSFRPSMS